MNVKDVGMPGVFKVIYFGGVIVLCSFMLLITLMAVFGFDTIAYDNDHVHGIHAVIIGFGFMLVMALLMLPMALVGSLGLIMLFPNMAIARRGLK